MATSGFVWWESPLATIRYKKGITSSYEREFPSVALYGHGQPTGHGIQFQGKGILYIIFVKDHSFFHNPSGHQI